MPSTTLDNINGSDLEVKNKGLNALFKELGEADAIRFLSQIRYDLRPVDTGAVFPISLFILLVLSVKSISWKFRCFFTF
jgi:hypothetical protein